MNDLFITYPHHSPSSISSFIERRATWFLQRFKGFKTPDNQLMARGRACEDGVNKYFKDGGESDFNDCAKYAQEVFNKATLGIMVTDDVRSSIIPLTKEILGVFTSDPAEDAFTNNECADPGGFGSVTPEGQREIMVTIPGLGLPIKGYTDYIYTKYNRIVDLKCTSKTPSNLTQAYIIQGSAYKYATGMDVEFRFAIPNKKIKIHRIVLSEQDYKQGMKWITGYCKIIERIIKSPISVDIMKDFFAPNPASFYNTQECKLIMEEFGFV